MRVLSLVVVVLAMGAILGAARSGSAAQQLAPSNTAPPTISGTAQAGSTLTTSDGSWAGTTPLTFSYQWRRCDGSGGSCSDIGGATTHSYDLKQVDVQTTLRAVVTAKNADGSASSTSVPTAIVRSGASQNAAPKNTSPPTISGSARVGQQLTGSDGSWSGSPTSFTDQWQRCDADGSNCANVAGETTKTYNVHLADLGFRLRVRVTAGNDKGSASANSGLTVIVAPAATIANKRPTLTILSVRFLGTRPYARFRVCDDSRKNLTIIETDSKPGVLSYTRRFSTLIPPRPCGVYTRNWLPAPRFRHGRYTITLRATDKSGLTSLPARRTFVR